MKYKTPKNHWFRYFRVAERNGYEGVRPKNSPPGASAFSPVQKDAKADNGGFINHMYIQKSKIIYIRNDRDRRRKWS